MADDKTDIAKVVEAFEKLVDVLRKSGGGCGGYDTHNVLSDVTWAASEALDVLRQGAPND